MLKLIAQLCSAAPYSQSRQFERDSPQEERESHEQYEERCWRLRAHTNSPKLVTLPNKELARAGNIVIPSVVFQRVLIEAARGRKDVIPGKGKKTYIDSFRTGIMVLDDLELPIKGSEVEHEWVSCSPRGLPGGTGVWRCFPLIPSWEGSVEFTILDEIVLTKSQRGEPIIIETLRTAGQFGIGRWRPIKSGGRYGRFEVISTSIEGAEEDAA